MTRCGRSCCISGIFPRPAAWESRGSIQARRTIMAKSDFAISGKLANDSGHAWNMDSLLLEPGLAAMSSAITEMPLGRYLHSRQSLKYEAVYFPLGYPMRVVSNS